MPSLSFELTTIAPPDVALLAAWAERGDEAAFAALVERHLALVHGVARRRLDDELAAREVTQAVFAILARKASTLRNVRVFAAWLHRVTAAQSARAIRQLVRDRRLRDSAMQHASPTSLLTMSTLKFSLTTAGVALLLTGGPAVWQGRELNRLRSAAENSTSPAAKAAVPHSPTGRAGGAITPATKQAGTSPAGDTPAALDMEGIGKAVEGSMKELMTEGVQRWANIEARRAALALGLGGGAERLLRQRVAQFMVQDMNDDAPERSTGRRRARSLRDRLEEQCQRRSRHRAAPSGAP